MKEYTYTGGESLLTQMGGIVTIIFGSLVGGVVVAIGIRTDSSFSSISCFVLWFLMIGWVVGLTLINSYPTIWVADNHLVISAFLFAKVRVAWTEIIDVEVGRVRFGHTLVRARRITPFHRVYGWMYSRSLYPSFVIGRGIQDWDELLDEIKKRAREAQISTPPKHRLEG